MEDGRRVCLEARYVIQALVVGEAGRQTILRHGDRVGWQNLARADRELRKLVPVERREVHLRRLYVSEHDSVGFVVGDGLGRHADHSINRGGVLRRLQFGSDKRVELREARPVNHLRLKQRQHRAAVGGESSRPRGRFGYRLAEILAADEAILPAKGYRAPSPARVALLEVDLCSFRDLADRREARTRARPQVDPCCHDCRICKNAVGKERRCD
ncbi:hypothetical protein D3C80_1351180 [compost metagenome]